MSKKKTVTVVVVSVLVVVAGFILYATVIKDDSKNKTEASKTCTTYNNRVEEQCIEDYIGLSQEEAIERAKQYRYNPKIVSIDGVGQVVTDEGGAIIHLEIKKGSVSGGYFEDGRKAN